MNVIWNKRLPTGAVRRYSPNEFPIPVNNDQRRFVSSHRRTTLVRADGWLAGYLDGELVGVVRERCTAASHAPNAVAFFGLADGDGTLLVRWDLADQVVEPLVRLPHRVDWLGTNDDATRLVVVSEQVVSLYDGVGAARWTRDLPPDDEEYAPRDFAPTRLGSIKNAVVEGDVVTLFWHLEDEDSPEVYASARLAPDQPIERVESATRPTWYRERASRQSIYRARALGEVAISRDGTRVATARMAWKRPEGTRLEVSEIYDSGMSSSWGGEALVSDLTFADDGELYRLASRNGWLLDRCFARKSEGISVETARLLPGTNRLIVMAGGAISLGDRLLMNAPREARICCASDASVIGIYTEPTLTLFDPDGNRLRSFAIPGAPWAIATKGTAVACRQGIGFVVVRPTGEIASDVPSDTAPAFSPDGTHVAFGYDWRLKIHNLLTGKTCRTEELVSPVVGVAFHGDLLFTETADGRLTEWSLEMP